MGHDIASAFSFVYIHIRNLGVYRHMDTQLSVSSHSVEVAKEGVLGGG